jgi:hypothetical protein
MPDRVMSAAPAAKRSQEDAVSIHTRKIYDACREAHNPRYKFFDQNQTTADHRRLFLFISIWPIASSATRGGYSSRCPWA